MYFEIWKNNKIVKRGTSILNTLSWDNELMYVPSTEIVLPIEYREYVSGREEIDIHVNGKVFPGIVVEIEENKAEETITLNLEHAITEWGYRQISVNRAVKDGKLNLMYEDEEKQSDPTVNDQLDEIYSDLNFACPGWNVVFLDGSGDREIEYVFSKQNKLEALTKAMELTTDLFWRVGFVEKRRVEIGPFGQKYPLMVSKAPTGARNVSIVEDPTIRHDFSSVINLATVYSEKSEAGMSSMTLREVYNDPSLQEDGFPVLILRENVNNERDYSMYTDQFPSLAPNNELEYAVMDEESVAMEAGSVIEGSFAFNDLSPFSVDENGETTEVTDEDRIEAAKTAYKAAVRKLKLSRRRLEITVMTEQLPSDLNVGDRIRFVYDNSLYVTEACSSYMKKILSMNDWFYVTKISYDIDINGTETDTLVLEKELRIDREVQS